MPSYKEQSNLEIKNHANLIIKRLPAFCETYFIGREARLASNSILSYAYELETFFNYLIQNNSYFKNKGMENITLNDLENLKSSDIEEFLHWLRYHVDESGIQHTNNSVSIEAYMSCLSSFWSYFCKRNMLSENPTAVIDRIKPKTKEIVYLNNEEKEMFLNSVHSGVGLTEREQKFHQKTEIRDCAILVLFLDTGMRISEIHGINLKDLNFNEHYVGIYRKGGKYDKVYFSDVAETYLLDYIENRKAYHPSDKEEALFLSSRGTRICIRQIQKMVKKYANASIPGKAELITPHKLRSTYATSLLDKTGDIRLVQIALGHENIATTTRYAAVNEAKKKEIRNL